MVEIVRGERQGGGGPRERTHDLFGDCKEKRKKNKNDDRESRGSNNSSAGRIENWLKTPHESVRGEYRIQ